MSYYERPDDYSELYPDPCPHPDRVVLTWVDEAYWADPFHEVDGEYSDVWIEVIARECGDCGLYDTYATEELRVEVRE